MRHPAILVLALSIVTWAGTPALAYDICTDAADCASRAQADIEGGRNEQALDALVAEADLATGSGDKEHLRAALEGLTAVNLSLGRPLMAHAWARAAMSSFDGDARAQTNLETVKPALQGMTPPPTGIAGTYNSYAGYGYWSELKLAERADGTVQASWFLMRFGAVPSAWDYGPAGMWELSGNGRYADGNLVITYQSTDGAPCEFTFKRTDLALELVSPQPEKLAENCRTGGAGAYPNGPFWLVDTAVPTFDDGGGSDVAEDEEEQPD